MKNSPHLPIMVKEVVELFAPVKMISFYEGTLGAGGHAKAILEAHSEIQCYMGCDADRESLELAKQGLKPWSQKVQFFHGNFADLDLHLQEKGIKQVDGFFLI